MRDQEEAYKAKIMRQQDAQRERERQRAERDRARAAAREEEQRQVRERQNMRTTQRLERERTRGVSNDSAASNSEIPQQMATSQGKVSTSIDTPSCSGTLPSVDNATKRTNTIQPSGGGPPPRGSSPAPSRPAAGGSPMTSAEHPKGRFAKHVAAEQIVAEAEAKASVQSCSANEDVEPAVAPPPQASTLPVHAESDEVSAPAEESTSRSDSHSLSISLEVSKPVSSAPCQKATGFEIPKRKGPVSDAMSTELPSLHNPVERQISVADDASATGGVPHSNLSRLAPPPPHVCGPNTGARADFAASQSLRMSSLQSSVPVQSSMFAMSQPAARLATPHANALNCVSNDTPINPQGPVTVPTTVPHKEPLSSSKSALHRPIVGPVVSTSLRSGRAIDDSDGHTNATVSSFYTDLHAEANNDHSRLRSKSVSSASNPSTAELTSVNHRSSSPTLPAKVSPRSGTMLSNASLTPSERVLKTQQHQSTSPVVTLSDGSVALPIQNQLQTKSGLHSESNDCTGQPDSNLLSSKRNLTEGNVDKISASLARLQATIDAEKNETRRMEFGISIAASAEGKTAIDCSDALQMDSSDVAVAAQLGPVTKILHDSRENVTQAAHHKDSGGHEEDKSEELGKQRVNSDLEQTFHQGINLENPSVVSVQCSASKSDGEGKGGFAVSVGTVDVNAPTDEILDTLSSGAAAPSSLRMRLQARYDRGDVETETEKQLERLTAPIPAVSQNHEAITSTSVTSSKIIPEVSNKSSLSTRASKSKENTSVDQNLAASGILASSHFQSNAKSARSHVALPVTRFKQGLPTSAHSKLVPFSNRGSPKVDITLPSADISDKTIAAHSTSLSPSTERLPSIDHIRRERYHSNAGFVHATSSLALAKDSNTLQRQKPRGLIPSPVTNQDSSKAHLSTQKGTIMPRKSLLPISGNDSNLNGNRMTLKERLDSRLKALEAVAGFVENDSSLVNQPQASISADSANAPASPSTLSVSHVPRNSSFDTSIYAGNASPFSVSSLVTGTLQQGPSSMKYDSMRADVPCTTVPSNSLSLNIAGLTSNELPSPSQWSMTSQCAPQRNTATAILDAEKTGHLDLTGMLILG